MSIFSQRSRLLSKGFTVTELLVVVTIMLILTGFFLIRQQNFNGSTVLSSLAYSVALSLRQAQLFGIATKETSINAFQGTAPAKAYGIYFDRNVTDSYILFADLDNDGQYDSPGESINTFRIATGFAISKLCADALCWTAGGSASIDNLTVLFRRPNPDACFATNLSPAACAISGTQVYTTGYMQITNGTNTRGVTINLSGQINVGGDGS
jgi:prepilin-type N-terminal cleavage/methylation domain-containing protein